MADIDKEEPEEEDYDKMQDEEFDKILAEIIRELTPGQLLSYPGIYEILAEELNNEVLDKWKEQRDKEKELLAEED